MTEENRALPEPELRGGDDPDFSAVKAPGQPAAEPVTGTGRPFGEQE
jgi:hypothetical protein